MFRVLDSVDWSELRWNAEKGNRETADQLDVSRETGSLPGNRETEVSRETGRLPTNLKDPTRDPYASESTRPSRASLAA
jgi:hypothetical protein